MRTEFSLRRWALRPALLLWLFLASGPGPFAFAETYVHERRSDFLSGWRDGNLVLQKDILQVGPKGLLIPGARWGVPIESLPEGRMARKHSIYRDIGENSSLFHGVGEWWRLLFPRDAARRGAFWIAGFQPSHVSPIWTWAGEGPPGEVVASAFWQGDLYCLTRRGSGVSPTLWASTPGRAPHLFWEPLPLDDSLVDFEPEALLGQGDRLFLLGRSSGRWEMVALPGGGKGKVVRLPIPRSETFEDLAGFAALRDVLFAYFRTERGYLLTAALPGEGPPEWHSVRYFPRRLAPTRLAAPEDALHLLHPSRPALNQALAGQARESHVRAGCFVHRFDLPGTRRIRSIHWESEPPGAPGWRLSWRVRPKYPQTALIPWSTPSSAHSQEVQQEADRLEYRLEWQKSGGGPAPGITRVWLEADALDQALPLSASADAPGRASESAEPRFARLESPSPRPHAPSGSTLARNRVNSPLSTEPGAAPPRRRIPPGNFLPIQNSGLAPSLPSRMSRSFPEEEEQPDERESLGPDIAPGGNSNDAPEAAGVQPQNRDQDNPPAPRASSSEQGTREAPASQAGQPQLGKTSPRPLPPATQPSAPATDIREKAASPASLDETPSDSSQASKRRRPPRLESEESEAGDNEQPGASDEPAPSIRPAMSASQGQAGQGRRAPSISSGRRGDGSPALATDEPGGSEGFPPRAAGQVPRLIPLEGGTDAPVQDTAAVLFAGERSADLIPAFHRALEREGAGRLPQLKAGHSPVSAALWIPQRSGKVPVISGVLPKPVSKSGLPGFLWGILGSGGGTLSERGRVTASDPAGTRAKFRPHIFQLSGRELTWPARAMRLLPVGLLILLTLMACHLVRKRCTSARREVRRENRQAAENARPLRTEWIPGAQGGQEPAGLMIGGEADAEALSGRRVSVEEPSLLGFLACRPLAALPQSSPEQRLVLVGDTLYLFSRGQAVFAARAIDGKAPPVWSTPLTLVPESGPGFSVTFFKKWFFFVPGSGYRSHTPILRSERCADGSLGPWREAGEVPLGIDHHALAAGSRSLFLLGGRTGKGPLTRVFQVGLDTQGQACDLGHAPALPTPLCPARCALIRNRLFAWQGPALDGSPDRRRLWSAEISSQDRLSAWQCRSTFPESGGAEELYAGGGKLLLIQKGRLYRASWPTEGAPGPWRRLEGCLPRHRSVLLLSDRLYLAGSETTPSAPRRSSHALLAAQLQV